MVSQDIYWVTQSEGSRSVIYFDKKLGLFVRCEIKKDQDSWVRDFRAYAGPEDCSETPDENLGRFSGPFLRQPASNPNALYIYDKTLRRFFCISFTGRSVIKGPQLPEDGSHKPVQIGSCSVENLKRHA